MDTLKQYAAVLVLSAALVASLVSVVVWYIALPIVAEYQGVCVYVLEWDSPDRKECPSELPSKYVSQSVSVEHLKKED